MGVKVLDTFDFTDDSRDGNRWPAEWFDGQVRKISLDLINISGKEDDVNKALSARRQSLRGKAKGMGGKLNFNWTYNGEGETTGFVLQFVKGKAAKG